MEPGLISQCINLDTDELMLYCQRDFSHCIFKITNVKECDKRDSVYWDKHVKVHFCFFAKHIYFIGTFFFLGKLGYCSFSLDFFWHWNVCGNLLYPQKQKIKTIFRFLKSYFFTFNFLAPFWSYFDHIVAYIFISNGNVNSRICNMASKFCMFFGRSDEKYKSIYLPVC